MAKVNGKPNPEVTQFALLLKMKEKQG